MPAKENWETSLIGGEVMPVKVSSQEEKKVEFIPLMLQFVNSINTSWVNVLAENCITP